MKKLIWLIVSLGTYNLAAQQSLIDSMRIHLKQTPIDSVKQSLYLNLSWEYSFSDLDSAKHFADLGIELAEKRANAQDLASAREMLAIIYDINGSIDEAVTLFLQAATYYEDLNAYDQLSSTYNNIGTLFFNNNQINKAGEYFQKSMEIDVLRGDSAGVGSSLVNMASVANRKGDHLKSYSYLMSAKRIKIGSSDGLTKRAIYEALGFNHIYRNNFDSAASYFEELLQLSREGNDVHSEISTKIGLVQSYMGLEKYQLALNQLREAEQLIEQFPEVYLSRNLMSIASDLFVKLGDFRKAYEYQSLYRAAEDSITKEEGIDKLNELEQKYQSEQRRKEIAELEVENQKSRNERNILILTSTLVVFGALFLFFLLRAKSKSGKVVKKSLEEKEILLKEIHHRVKNNLQVISSLLSLQSRFIEDEKAQEAVNEGQNRVKSMALIHQKLYQRDNLMGVEVLDYIQNLTATLKSAYGVDDEKIEVVYEVEKLNIDVDTLIPIGLILNELISNSFKHAYPEGKNGELKIKLQNLNNQLELVVEDDGVGTTKDLSKSDSFGIRMIKSLAMKLEAQVIYDFKAGFKASLLISNYKLV